MRHIDTSFPGTNKKGCFFHFSQAIFRKIRSLGLQNRYKDDGNFAHKVRMLAALAFVPLPDVIDAFESVADEFPLAAQEVIDYFEDRYIRRLRPGGHRRAPLFDLALWNMYDQTIGDLPRTNNAVEGWHRRSTSPELPEIYRHLEAGTKSKPCQHFTSSSWPSTTNLP